MQWICWQMSHLVPWRVDYTIYCNEKLRDLETASHLARYWSPFVMSVRSTVGYHLRLRPVPSRHTISRSSRSILLPGGPCSLFPESSSNPGQPSTPPWWCLPGPGGCEPTKQCTNCCVSSKTCEPHRWTESWRSWAALRRWWFRPTPWSVFGGEVGRASHVFNRPVFCVVGLRESRLFVLVLPTSRTQVETPAIVNTSSGSQKHHFHVRV